MDRVKLVVIAVVQAATSAAVTGFRATAGTACNRDDRGSRRARWRRCSIRRSQFGTAISDQIYHVGWVPGSFPSCQALIVFARWYRSNGQQSTSQLVSTHRVAVALYYLMQAGSVVVDIANAF